MGRQYSPAESAGIFRSAQRERILRTEAQSGHEYGGHQPEGKGTRQEFHQPERRGVRHLRHFHRRQLLHQQFPGPRRNADGADAAGHPHGSDNAGFHGALPVQPPVIGRGLGLPEPVQLQRSAAGVAPDRSGSDGLLQLSRQRQHSELCAGFEGNHLLHQLSDHAHFRARGSVARLRHLKYQNGIPGGRDLFHLHQLPGRQRAQRAERHQDDQHYAFVQLRLEEQLPEPDRREEHFLFNQGGRPACWAPM